MDKNTFINIMGHIGIKGEKLWDDFKNIIPLAFAIMISFMIPCNTKASTQSDYVDARVNAAIAEKHMDAAPDLYTKVKLIDEWMFENCKYSESRYNDTAYTLLKNGSSNCQGFCYLTMDFCKKLGIECDMVYQEFLGHRWNVIRMEDGKYYFFDVCSEVYMNRKGMMLLKGSDTFFYKMNSSIKYDVSKTDYNYTPKKEEVKHQEQNTEKPEQNTEKPEQIIVEGGKAPTKATPVVPVNISSILGKIPSMGITIGKEIGSKIVFK